MKACLKVIRKVSKKVDNKAVKKHFQRLSEIRTFHGMCVTESDGGTERRWTV
jgi:hypothetical protein